MRFRDSGWAFVGCAGLLWACGKVSSDTPDPIDTGLPDSNAGTPVASAGESAGGVSGAATVTAGGGPVVGSGGRTEMNPPSGAGAGNTERAGDTGAGGIANAPPPLTDPKAGWVLLEPPAIVHRPSGSAANVQPFSETFIVAAAADGGVLLGEADYQFRDSAPGPYSVQSKGFVWRKETGVVDLGEVPGDDAAYTQPFCISADGSQVSGELYHTGVFGDGTETTAVSLFGGFFHWTAQGGVDAWGGATGSHELMACSRDGKAVFGQINFRPFLWTESRGYIDLTGSPSWAPEMSIQGMSDDGSTLFGGFVGTAGALRFTLEGGFEALGTLPNTTDCNALLSTPDGSTLVGVCQDVAASSSPAFWWTRASGMVAIEDTRSTANWFEPKALSDDGNSVFGRYQSEPVTGLARWKPSNGVELLGDDSSIDNHARMIGLTPDARALYGTNNDDLGFQWREGQGLRVIEPLRGDMASTVTGQTADGRLLSGESDDFTQSQGFRRTAVLWDTAGGRSIPEELAVWGVDLGSAWPENARGLWLSDSVVVYGDGTSGADRRGRAWVAWFSPPP